MFGAVRLYKELLYFPFRGQPQQLTVGVSMSTVIVRVTIVEYFKREAHLSDPPRNLASHCLKALEISLCLCLHAQHRGLTENDTARKKNPFSQSCNNMLCSNTRLPSGSATKALHAIHTGAPHTATSDCTVLVVRSNHYLIHFRLFSFAPFNRRPLLSPAQERKPESKP